MVGRDPGGAGGFALLIVLWTLVLISLLVSAIAASGSGRTRQAGDLRRNAQLRAEADGGIEEAVFHLLDGSKAHWAADGAIHRIRHRDVVLSLRLASEAGKINPNRASPELLASLLQAVGVDARRSAAIVANIVAWRFPGGTLVELSGGGRRAGRDYLPPGAPFESLAELGLVPGIDPALLATLTPHLSLYHDGDPELAAADPVVRQAMLALSGPDVAPDPSGQPARADETAVTVTALAEDGAGRRAVRRAIVLTGAAGTDGRPYRIMSIEAPSG